jgi:4-amino-4-deoxy-L-arabinose transferase-like glycosyltransferase
MTKGESAIRNPQSAIVWLLFALAIVIVYFVGLTLPLVGPDEPRYAQVAREMFERGDLVTPTLGGFNWFEKPALLYWLEFASYSLFGVTEFAARFGSALFGLGTVVSLWILGKYVDEADELANWLGLIGASTVGLIAFAHGASFDIILTFPITAAMVSFFVYDKTRRRPALIGFYFFIGLALLAKGLVGIVFPFAIVSFYHLILWKLPSRTLVISVLWGTVVAIVIAGTWYLPMYLRHGYEFVDQFFIQHHFQRFTSNKYLHPQPFYFFIWVLPLMTIPWVPFFLAALWKLGRQFIRRDADPASTLFRLKVFALAWIAVPLVFFSFSGSKLPGYILPVVPAASILAATFIYEFVQKGTFRRYAIQTIAAVTLVIVAIIAIFIAPRFAETDSVKGLFAAAAERGLSGSRVMMLHGISHNAEFYAPGRIVRDVDGRQKRFPGPHQVAEELNRGGGNPALVIVPVEYLSQLLASELMRSELIKENGEVALVLVKQK